MKSNRAVGHQIEPQHEDLRVTMPSTKFSRIALPSHFAGWRFARPRPLHSHFRPMSGARKPSEGSQTEQLIEAVQVLNERLGNPVTNATERGLGPASGWKCNALSREASPALLRSSRQASEPWSAAIHRRFEFLGFLRVKGDHPSDRFSFEGSGGILGRESDDTSSHSRGRLIEGLVAKGGSNR